MENVTLLARKLHLFPCCFTAKLSGNIGKGIGESFTTNVLFIFIFFLGTTGN